MREDYVTIYHPSGIQSRVMSKSVAAWVRNGWTVEEPVSEKTDLPQVEESESKTDTTEAY
ncbi:MAG: hypothetical protein E6Q97_04095 [Desulfurellales bacterium]|nr:MAG: hypothetical protein E6Q97_04095 [Desulfurellales bacterium]